MINIKYPEVLHNNLLYERTNSTPISEYMFKARWHLLEHVLRIQNNIPAKQDMIYYFQNHKETGLRGQLRLRIATKIDRDL